MSILTGVICLDKPEGMTSFSAVAAVRRITGEKKAGHCGTLDPMATGVLPVFLGGATRFIELLPSHDKGYRARVKCGISTDTLDITGAVLEEKKPDFTRAELTEVLSSFRGEQLQLPPMYSALKQGGVRLYELARRGIEVEREKRPVNIYSLILREFSEESFEFVIDVRCSKGTYIRSLAADIGEKLGCGAALSELRRTFAVGVDEKNCITPEKLRECPDPSARLLGVDALLREYPAAFVSPAQARRFSNGGALDLARLKAAGEAGLYRVYSPENEFLGVGEIAAGGEEMKVRRVMVN